MEANINLLGYVQLLDALAEKEMIKRDPDNHNNLLIFKTDVEVEPGVLKDGYVSENIFEVATQLFHNPESYNELVEVLKDNGYQPIFANKTFVGLGKIA